jgi:hypothetical protein
LTQASVFRRHQDGVAAFLFRKIFVRQVGLACLSPGMTKDVHLRAKRANRPNQLARDATILAAHVNSCRCAM